MVAVRVSAVVGEDRRLVIELPEEIPVGPVELIIQASESVSESGEKLPLNPLREAIRAKMLAAGILGTAHMPPSDIVAPTEAEAMAAGELAPGARPSHELIAEDRAAR